MIKRPTAAIWLARAQASTTATAGTWRSLRAPASTSPLLALAEGAASLPIAGLIVCDILFTPREKGFPYDATRVDSLRPERTPIRRALDVAQGAQQAGALGLGHELNDLHPDRVDVIGSHGNIDAHRHDLAGGKAELRAGSLQRFPDRLGFGARR